MFEGLMAYGCIECGKAWYGCAVETDCPRCGRCNDYTPHDEATCERVTGTTHRPLATLKGESE